MMKYVLALLLFRSVLLGAPWDPKLPARAIFDQMEAQMDPAPVTFGKATGEPGGMAWGESYLLTAYVVMYEATGETRYLDKFVARWRKVLALRDDRQGKRDVLRNKVMAAWGSTRYSGGKWTCWNVHAGMLAAPAARFVRLVKERPALQKAYSTASKEFLAALEETVAAFQPDWRDGPNDDEGYYVEPALGSRPVPLNQQNALGRALVDLWKATGKTTYRDQATKLAHFFKRRLRNGRDNAYDWAYHPGLNPPYGGGSEDISHASINVDFAVRCYENGIVFTKSDIERFANTLLKVVHKGDDHFSLTVGGQGGDAYAAQIGRWGMLASVNPQVATVIRNYFYRRDPPLGGTTTLLGLAYLARYGH